MNRVLWRNWRNFAGEIILPGETLRSLDAAKFYGGGALDAA